MALTEFVDPLPPNQDQAQEVVAVFPPFKRSRDHASNDGQRHLRRPSRQRSITFGNKGGPGRPRRATERDYLTVLREEVPPERWRAICLRAVADAEAGDPKAREWIAKYLVGAPGEQWSLAAIAQLEECERAREETRA